MKECLRTRDFSKLDGYGSWQGFLDKRPQDLISVSVRPSNLSFNRLSLFQDGDLFLQP